MAFLQALGGILSLLLVVLTGFILARRGFFTQGSTRLLPRFITNIALPPFLACTIISSFEKSGLIHLLYGALVPLLQMMLLFALAFAAAIVLRVPKKRFGLFCACISNPNTIFIGIPVNMALFGEEALSYVLIYYFASTSFFWTAGNYFISRDQTDRASVNVLAGQPAWWKRMVSAPILGFLAGLGIVITQMPIADFIMQAARLLGQTTTPLALIFIGISLNAVNWKSFKPDRDLLLALLGRMVLSPLVMVAILQLVNLPALMGQVFIIQSSLPVLMQVAILSAYYNTDPEFGSLMVTISTIACVLTVPLYMALMG